MSKKIVVTGACAGSDSHEVRDLLEHDSLTGSARVESRLGWKPRWPAVIFWIRMREVQKNNHGAFRVNRH